MKEKLPRGKPKLKNVIAFVLMAILLFSALPVAFAAPPSYTTSALPSEVTDELPQPPEDTRATGDPATEGVPYPDPVDEPPIQAMSGGITTMAYDKTVSNDQTMHMYFTRWNGSYWQPLQTPTHYTSDGKIAYCLEQIKGSPAGYSYDEIYLTYGKSEMNVEGTTFPPEILEGLCAIVRSGYPASTLLVDADAARQITALALRVYLAESGYSSLMQPGMAGFAYVGLAAGTPGSYLDTAANLVQIGHDAKNSFAGNVTFEIIHNKHDCEANGTVRYRKQKDSEGFYYDWYKSTIELNVSGIKSYEIVQSGLNGVKATRNGNVWTFEGTEAQFKGMTLSFTVKRSAYVTGFSLLVGSSSAAQTLLGIPSSIPPDDSSTTETPDEPWNPQAPEKGRIVIKKVDTDTGALVQGAQFQLHMLGSSGKWYEIPAASGGVLTTGSDGIATSGLLECEVTYRATEINFPAGYWQVETTGSIYMAEGMNTGKTNPETGKKYPDGVIEIGDTPIKTQITIEKRDPETGDKPQGEGTKSFEGATFEVRADETIYTPTGLVAYEKDSLVDTVTTNAAGTATTIELYPGRFRILETAAPGAYFTNGVAITVTTDIGDSQNAVVQFDTVYKDDAKKYIIIRKNDDVTAGRPQGNSTFENAEFKIVADQDIYDAGGVLKHKKGDLVQGRDNENSTTIVGSRLLTGSDGTVRSQALYPAKYLVYEIKAPRGYYWNREPISVDVTSAGNGNTHEVVFEKIFLDEVQKGSIQLNKFLGDNDVNYDPVGTELELESGAKFEVFLKSAGSYADALESERCIMVTGYDADGNKYTDPTMQGYAISPLLPYGVYTVRQVSGAPGHALMQDVDVFLYDDEYLLPIERPKKPTDNLFPLIMNNHRLKTLIEIYKIDATSGKPVILDSATFEIYNPQGERIYDIVNIDGKLTAQYEFTTDSKGRILLPIGYRHGYGVGVYTLKELEAPHNYFREHEELTFEITDEMIKNAQHTFILEQMPSREDFPTEEAYENFIRDNTYPVIRLEYDNKPVRGKITINKSGLLFMGVEEEETEYGTVYKPVYKHGKLGGCTFYIRAKDDIYSGDGELQAAKGEIVDTIVTTSSKTDSSILLYPGVYEVFEDADKLPPGYVPSNKVYEVEIKYEGQDVEIVETAYAIRNQYQQAEIEIIKQAEVLSAPDGGDAQAEFIREFETVPGSGFVFGLFADCYIDDSGQPVDVTGIELTDENIESLGITITKDSLVAVGTTGEDGKLKFSGSFPHATYYILELATKENYFLDETRYPVDFSYNPEVRQIEVAPLDILNRLRMFPMEISKEDITDAAPVPGALIEIADHDGNVVHREYTKEDGTIKFTIEPGKYKFRETIIVDGFIENTSILYFEVSEDGEITGDNKITNTPTELVISKYDAEDGSLLDGAVFELQTEDGETVLLAQKEDGTYYPSEDGEATFTITEGEAVIKYLKAAQQYRVIERKAPGGFILDETPNIFEIAKNGGVTGERITNEPTELTIRKVTSFDGTPLDGAKFELQDEDGNIILLKKALDGTYYPSDKGKAVFETDKGIATIKRLSSGVKYSVIEREAPQGFLLDETPVIYEIAEDGTVTGQEAIENAPLLVLSITKMNSADNSLLDGAEFVLRDAGGKEMLLSRGEDGAYRPDANGSAVITTTNGIALIKDLPPQLLRLTETKAPDGFDGYFQAIDIPMETKNTEDNPFLVTVFNAPTGSDYGTGAQTGGDGLPYMALYIAVGAAIAALAVFWYIRKKKGAKQPENSISE